MMFDQDKCDAPGIELDDVFAELLGEYRVDARKGFVEQIELRVLRKRTR